MKQAMLPIGMMAALLSMSASARAEQFGAPPPPRLPFVMTLSNTTPLAFGMDAEQTARALGQPLRYVRGRPGNEIYLALRNIGGSGLIPYRHRLFLQFRHGRLAGWKEDYGENWMWE
ncbi:hypothetical protein AYJ54_16030 [Bradyrhizobium centrolobii]|uniref:Bll0838 protein n=1 Tax=Bradyrhizobium centrolobii TaxID=1505087 RepID=A0A176YPW9_9BRAD|nr:hypothetical protein [Bradyrhizobium centrolobii]OAF08237.1 hypothetical protein AYJ54_16030 [Bradyrhizobium centrolobii]